MITDSLEFSAGGKLPDPAIGLSPAIHDVEIEPLPVEGEFVKKPLALVAKDCKNKVYQNSGDVFIVWPRQGNRPAYQLSPGDLIGCDGRFFYPVVQKEGTTSYYPKAFERTLYTCAYEEDSFPLPDSLNPLTLAGVAQMELLRHVKIRLFANNTIAVWRLVFECGERLDDYSEKIITKNAILNNSADVVVETSGLSRLMRVAGSGIPDGTIIMKVSSNSIRLSKPSSAGGSAELQFKSVIGPNIAGIKWLDPMLDVQFRLTDVLCEQVLGIKIQRVSPILPAELLYSIGPRNSLGFQGFRNAYGKISAIPLSSLPSIERFLVRVRLTGFDIEDTVLNPRGYVGYTLGPIPYSMKDIAWWPPKGGDADMTTSGASAKEASEDSR